VDRHVPRTVRLLEGAKHLRSRGHNNLSVLFIVVLDSRHNRRFNGAIHNGLEPGYQSRPGCNSSATGFSSSAVVVILVPPLAELFSTLRTNTSDGLRRSADADCIDELEGAGACWLVVGSEKSIFPSAYGPHF